MNPLAPFLRQRDDAHFRLGPSIHELFLVEFSQHALDIRSRDQRRVAQITLTHPAVWRACNPAQDLVLLERDSVIRYEVVVQSAGDNYVRTQEPRERGDPDPG